MSIWFTSDHHFGHANIIEYCERPSNSVEQMNISMIGSWNRVVAPKDTVYSVGDFAMQLRLVADFLPKLNSKKVLIAGTFIEK
jgi:calcineurin-like phosphoesterase family protein